MPRSPCIHRALPPFGPPDGVCRCSLEGSASGLSPPAISSPKSSRSWRRHRSCLLLVVLRGVQPHGSWHPSAIARLQGFSSRSLAAISRRWSSRGMTTSLVVGRSKSGYDLPPALSFKDVYHLCWGGGRAELGPRLSHGLTTRFFPQCPREKGIRQPCEGGKLRVRGVGRLQVPPATACPAPQPGWLWCCLWRCLLPLGWVWLSVHRTGDSRVVRRSATPTASPALPTAPGGRTRHRTSWGRWRRSWMVFSSLPQ
jgi:hypothetical protein